VESVKEEEENEEEKQVDETEATGINASREKMNSQGSARSPTVKNSVSGQGSNKHVGSIVSAGVTSIREENDSQADDLEREKENDGLDDEVLNHHSSGAYETKMTLKVIEKGRISTQDKEVLSNPDEEQKDDCYFYENSADKHHASTVVRKLGELQINIADVTSDSAATPLQKLDENIQS